MSGEEHTAEHMLIGWMELPGDHKTVCTESAVEAQSTYLLIFLCSSLYYIVHDHEGCITQLCFE